MLLDRLQRPVRGVRLVRREQDDVNAPFRIQIVPLRDLTSSDVDRIKDELVDTPGPIVTSALTNREQSPFLAAGFSPRESLYLLRHDLRDIAEPSGPTTIRNARRSDLDAVLTIDHQGFDDFWAFDREALHAARKATPTHRYVVATHNRQVVGYAVSGHAGSTSYLQRLSVATDFRGRGAGSQLILDALAWGVRSGANAMLVNTQEVNLRALEVYQSHGFVLDDERLTVLEWNR